jgi:hypothetical protein
MILQQPSYKRSRTLLLRGSLLYRLFYDSPKVLCTAAGISLV